MIQSRARTRFAINSLQHALRRFLLLAAYVLLNISQLANHANAAMAPIGFDELVATSDLVVVGTTVDIQGYWSGDIIMSKVKIEISQIVVGDTAGVSAIEIDIAGGIVGDVGLLSSNQPLPEKGEQVLLFLKAEGSVGVYTVNGLAQGYATIVDGKVPRFGQSIETLVNSIKKLKQ